MRQVQEKKLERSVQLRKERILRKKIRNGHTPSNTAVNEEEEEQMEQMAKVEEVQEVEEKLEKAEEELIITPYPSGDHTRTIQPRQTDRVVHVLLPEESVRWEHQIHIKLAQACQELSSGIVIVRKK
ncbi:hypothetical protein ACLKA6_002060 [Drosophila palustris]